MSQEYILILVVVNLPPIVLQVVLLLSSILMNGAGVNVSRMLLLLAPVSASALSRCSLLLTMIFAIHYRLVGWLLDKMILLA
jgi:hypothetical protein